MTFIIRPFGGEFAGIAQLLNEINPDPITPDRLEAMHARFPADGVRRRLIAVAPDGSVIGYANASHTDSMKPGMIWLTLTTAPSARRQGVATALLAALEPWAREHGGTCLQTGVPDDDRIAITFARGRGFHVESIQLTSQLDVPTFDESPWAGVVDRVKASGIRFFTYPEQPGEETFRKLYDLYKVTDLDSPGYLGVAPENYPPYEEWYAELFSGDRTVLEGLIIAADGNRFVGCTIVQKEGEGALYTEYTGVLREYRGRQIGLALKLLSVRFAKAYGAPYMTTRNNSTNGPMLAVNEKMGYRKVHGRAWLVKEL
ncbi:MAG TPA: GNAT family N-acetyltransferase [Symbiobacteriaceae bacterium]|nr:GNAT family N-acetyltransferase [Symbiobacteriaceae bacterium]